jgi:glycosyltransferase involved in cell wall biosynthesis
MSKKITVIIPCFNEVNTIKVLIKKILRLKINIEIILVDDFSNDGTRELIKKEIEAKIYKVLYLSKNKGKGFAIRSAVPFVRGEIIIIQDADLEYSPSDYKKLIKPIINKESLVVYGSRVLNKNNYKKRTAFLNLIRIWGNQILTFLSNIINNQKLTDAHTCYKVFDSKIFKKIKLKENRFAFCPEITTKISNLKLSILEVPIHYKGRSYKNGKKIGFIDFFFAIKALIKYKLTI